MAKDILVIVESPGKIKKISSYLGKGYVVRASVGHIIDLSTGNKNYPLGVDLVNNYTPKYKIIPDKKDVVQSLIDASTGASKIYLATDNDREGEAIAYHLQDCLESTGKEIKRVTFNAITKTEVTTAVQNPGALNQDLYNAQQARRVLDRIVGFLASEQLRYAFGPHSSAGRVQSVAVRLIVDREREIETFIPEEYWNITTALAKSPDQDSFVAKYANKVTNEKTAKQIKTDLDKDSYIIKDIVAKEKKRNALPPLITSKLQQAASTRFGFSMSKTMRAAQGLYEAGYITYMRTDSPRIDPGAQKEARKYLISKGFQVPATPNVYGSKGSAQDAHECIRPTDPKADPPSIFASDEQQKIYRLIWERFLASQMEPAVYDTVNVTVESSSGHLLKANGRTLKYEGWLAIATDQKKLKDDDDIQLPVLKVKDQVVLVPPKVKAEQKFTQPPPRYGDASLNKELEKRGIGRPSTYAAIIEKICARNYVEVIKKTYHPTELGKKIVDSLIKYFKFMDYQYTADMETRLDLIADGKLGYVEMLDEFFVPFQAECKLAETGEAIDYGIPCPECQSKTIMRHGRFGFYMACISRPRCKGTLSVDIVDGKPVIKKAFEKKIAPGVQCPKCNSGMVRRDGKFGPFYSCEAYPKCKGSRKIPFGKKCSDCGSELFMTIFYRSGAGEKKLACMGYPNCKHVEDLPADASNDWIDPVKVKPPQRKRSTKKVLGTNRKKKK